MDESCSTMTPGTLNLCELYIFTIVLMGMYCWVIPTHSAQIYINSINRHYSLSRSPRLLNM